MTKPAGTRLDHDIFGVRDIDAAVVRFRSEFGLSDMARAEHPEWGTRNAVLPVGRGQFIELLAVADQDADTPLVRGLKFLLRDGDRMVGLCLRPPDLDAVAERLSLRIIPGERHEDDRVVRFRRTVPRNVLTGRSSSSGTEPLSSMSDTPLLGRDRVGRVRRRPAGAARLD